MLIPADLGRIEQIEPNGGRHVYLVLDAHDSLEAQENISKIIRHLAGTRGIRTIFEEGYEGRLPISEYFGSIPDPLLREETAYYFLDMLEIGGAEFAAVRNPELRLVGADSLELHLANVALYRKASEEKAAILADVDRMASAVRNLLSREVSKDAKDWIRLRERFESKEIPLDTYVVRSLKISRKKGAVLEARFPWLEAFGETPAPETIKSLSKIDLPSSLARFHDAMADLLMNAEQRSFYDEIARAERFRSTASLELPGSEWPRLLEMSGHTTRETAGRLARRLRKPQMLSSRWESSIRWARAFYETAAARDEHVVKTLRGFFSGSLEKETILVFGGFHRLRIMELLRKEGIACTVILPKITGESLRHRNFYRQSMERPDELLRGFSGASRSIGMFERIEAGLANPSGVERGILQVARWLEADPPAESREELYHSHDLIRRDLVTAAEARSEKRPENRFTETGAPEDLPGYEKLRGILHDQIEDIKRYAEEQYPWSISKAIPLAAGMAGFAFGLWEFSFTPTPTAPQGGPLIVGLFMGGVFFVVFWLVAKMVVVFFEAARAGNRTEAEMNRLREELTDAITAIDGANPTKKDLVFLLSFFTVRDDLVDLKKAAVEKMAQIGAAPFIRFKLSVPLAAFLVAIDERYQGRLGLISPDEGAVWTAARPLIEGLPQAAVERIRKTREKFKRLSALINNKLHAAVEKNIAEERRRQNADEEIVLYDGRIELALRKAEAKLGFLDLHQISVLLDRAIAIAAPEITYSTSEREEIYGSVMVPSKGLGEPPTFEPVTRSVRSLHASVSTPGMLSYFEDYDRLARDLADAGVPAARPARKGPSEGGPVRSEVRARVAAHLPETPPLPDEARFSLSGSPNSIAGINVGRELVLIDFRDMVSHWTDSQIREIFALAEGKEAPSILIFNLDVSSTLGRFLEGHRTRTLRTETGLLKEILPKAVSRFSGPVIFISNQPGGVAPADAALLHERIPDQLFVASHENAIGGTLGIILHDLRGGRLKKQIPDGYGYDSYGRLVIRDNARLKDFDAFYASRIAFVTSA